MRPSSHLCLLLLVVCQQQQVTANCPPSVVSSFEELHEYCPDASAVDGDYKCYKHNRVVCQGTIDHRRIPPVCTHSVIRDCSDNEYYRACTYGHKNCGYQQDKNTPSFVCWDKQQGHWCQGVVAPDQGTVHHPTCPPNDDVDLYDCGELYRYGFNVDRDCDCSAFFGGPIQYECRDPATHHVSCSYRSNFFGGGGNGHSSLSWNSGWTLNSLALWGAPSHHQATEQDAWQWWSGGMVFVAVFAAGVLLYRYSHGKKTRGITEMTTAATTTTTSSSTQSPHEGTALLPSFSV